LRNIEPKLFDFALSLHVVGEKVARDLDLLVPKVEVLLQETNEEAHHLWIGVVEPKRIPILLTFRPIEHAAGDMA
jgi:hypothetical protein